MNTRKRHAAIPFGPDDDDEEDDDEDADLTGRWRLPVFPQAVFPQGADAESSNKPSSNPHCMESAHGRKPA